MTTWADERLAQLRADWPDWDIWYVLRYLVPAIWCAKPKGAEVATINTDSPERLVELIEGLRINRTAELVIPSDAQQGVGYR
jgi:hypothetical protein